MLHACDLSHNAKTACTEFLENWIDEEFSDTERYEDSVLVDWQDLLISLKVNL